MVNDWNWKQAGFDVEVVYKPQIYIQSLCKIVTCSI